MVKDKLGWKRLTRITNNELEANNFKTRDVDPLSKIKNNQLIFYRIQTYRDLERCENCVQL